MRDNGHTVFNCSEDADTQIATAAISHAINGTPCTVIADDTDIIILLIHHFKEDMADICFSSEKCAKSWSMRDVVQQIGPTMKDHILFLHAWHGCDTTSAIFEKGKTALCKKIESSVIVRQLATILSNPTATTDDVIDAGSKLFVIMYGGDVSGSLTKHR